MWCIVGSGRQNVFGFNTNTNLKRLVSAIGLYLLRCEMSIFFLTLKIFYFCRKLNSFPSSTCLLFSLECSLMVVEKKCTFQIFICKHFLKPM